MQTKPDRDVIRLSVARDLGSIELLHARLYRRGLPPHWHDEYSVSVNLRGGLAFDYRGSKHLAPDGAISCNAPGEVHNASSGGEADWEFVSLLVPTACVQEILTGMERRRDLPDLTQRIVSDPSIAKRLVALYRHLTNDGDMLARQSNSLLTLGAFFERYSSARGRATSLKAEPDRVRRAREMLHECFADPIPLAELAASAGLSPYYFLRTFRAVVGMTPHAYLNQVRVMEAKRRLAEGEAPADAALACGFCDQSHLARQFKRTACVTPGDYQGAYARKRSSWKSQNPKPHDPPFEFAPGCSALK